MGKPTVGLPPEIWIHVLRHLSPADRFSVRASCKYFKHLVDQRTLWRDWSVVLGFQRGAYNSRFWDTLRRRGVAGVVMRGTKAKVWKQLALFLPSLTTVVGIFEETIWVIHSILNCLPKLKHLSLSIVQRLFAFSNISGPKPGPVGGAGSPVLSSLELIHCIDHSLPEDVMRLMPGLKTLAVYYRCSNQETTEGCPSPDRHPLNTWLSDLPQLSTLVIAKGPPVKNYVSSIPATVTNLTLCAVGLSSEDMAAVAVQVPNLLHLHLDPWPSHLGARTAQIPHLFPKLKSLKLRHEHVPERDFLHLHQLQDLGYLEILDSSPQLSKLAGKLQALTDYRLQVTTSPRRRDVFSCHCACQVY
uniref:F-box domain-containing protein n=1 Tax=Gasterosteus aculeatus aculeatus TaxID=481459 RepID=A0AAQ4QGU4_GASAC|nr:uncharacterized protein im:7136021 [Gasterosteus aculeatus aculeatus]